MLILSIECSGLTGSVAVCEGQRTICSIVSGVKRTHSEKLMPLVDLVLKQAQVQPQQLEAIGVSIGPGSFTGLRIGVGVAKGLSFSLGIPVIPVETLPVIAHNLAGVDKPLCVLTPSRKDEIFSGLFRWSEHRLIRLEEDRAESPESLVSRIDEPTYFVGTAASMKSEFFRAVLEDRFLLVPEFQHQPRAEIVAWLAQELFASGHSYHSYDVSPKYVREPTPVVRLQAKQAKAKP